MDSFNNTFLQFCFFENILVYACAKEDNPDSLLVLYNCKTERKVTIKHYPGQRLVCLTAGSDFCVATTRVMQETDQVRPLCFEDFDLPFVRSKVNK
jgi:hypothetical protein